MSSFLCYNDIMKDDIINIKKLSNNKDILEYLTNNEYEELGVNKELYDNQGFVVFTKSNSGFLFLNKRSENKNNRVFPIYSDYGFNIKSLEKIINIVYKKNPLIGNLIYELQSNGLKEINSMSCLFALNTVMRHADFFQNRDNLKHLKNYGYDFDFMIKNVKLKNEHKKHEVIEPISGSRIPENLEDLDDEYNMIICTQKAKKIIQKVYSDKYRHLIKTDNGMTRIEILDNYMILVDKEVELKNIKTNFAKKLARFKNQKQHDKALELYIEKISGWSKDVILKKSKELGATIQHSDENILSLKIHNYEQSKELGSGQWCISYSKDYFIDYKGDDNGVYFIYDFNKKPADKTSMLGVVLDRECSIRNQHWRDDSSADPYDYEGKIVAEKYIDYLPKSYSLDEIKENCIDALNLYTNKNDFTNTLLNMAISTNYEILEYGIEHKLFDKEYTSHYSDKLARIYKNDCEFEDYDDSLNLLHTKKKNKLIEKIAEKFDSYHIPSYSDEFLKTAIMKKNYKIVNNIIDKSTKESDFSSVIDYLVFYKKDEFFNILEPLKGIKDGRNRPLFDPSTLSSKIVACLRFQDNNDFMEVIPDILKLNKGEISLGSYLLNLRNEPEKDDGFRLKNYNRQKEALRVIIQNMSAKSLKKAQKDAKKHLNMDKLDSEVRDILNISPKKKQLQP